jgi:hypothetical protein
MNKEHDNTPGEKNEATSAEETASAQDSVSGTIDDSQKSEAGPGEEK